MRVLVLRFDAPLMSFGAPMVDQNGVIQRFPARSMLTGLFANALGWEHSEFGKLDALQDRVRFSARIDRRGEELVDYQTVDLGQPWLDPEQAGWTTQGEISSRAGANSTGTHIRKRHFRADSVVTVAVTLAGPGDPTVEALAEALRFPARPVFLGRKACVPASPLVRSIVDAASCLDALTAFPRDARADGGSLQATWFNDDGSSFEESHLVATTDERDWRAQVHVGRRLMREGLITPPEPSHGQ